MSDALTFISGKKMPNPFMLAPLTNMQSNDDGTLSEAEYKWLTMRAMGGFGLTMTCATFAEQSGKGFDGQLAAVDDNHMAGLTRLAAGIKQYDSLAYTQIIHGGMRTFKEFTGQQPVGPSANEEFKSRAMTLDEIKATEKAFIHAAVMSQKAGFDGMEIHGAHGYLLCQFLSSEINKRDDDYGGSLENRTRLIDDIITGIGAACGPGFSLALRLSPDRFGIDIVEIASYFERLCDGGALDFIDMSLWDSFQKVESGPFKGQRLVDVFAGLERQQTKLTVAGKIMTGGEVQDVLDSGVDFVALGRAGILHHNWPQKFAADQNFQSLQPPASRAHLAAEGLSDGFIDYMSTWEGFVEEGGLQRV